MGKSTYSHSEVAFILMVIFVALLWIILGAVFVTNQSYAAEGKMNIKPFCIMYGRSECDVDTFKYDGHVCVRWHNAYGSDMECWEDR